jgi:uncharacterized protein (DUF1697 family)
MVYRHYPSSREHERHRNDQEEVTNYAVQSDGVHRMRYVALLRGINVGGKTLIKMTDLNTCIEELGLDDVSTFIASGNVLFESDEHDAAKLQTKIERAIEQRFRLPVKVVVLDRAAYARIVKAIPTSWVDDASVSANVAFVRRGTDPKQVARELRPDRCRGDEGDRRRDPVGDETECAQPQRRAQADRRCRLQGAARAQSEYELKLQELLSR